MPDTIIRHYSKVRDSKERSRRKERTVLDHLGRDIHYLRMSLTERCNLKCIYCRDESAFCKVREELNTEQYRILIRQFVSLGIRKIRLTGGEPLVRRDLTEIVRMIAAYDEIRDLSMTTNAQGLAARLPELKRAGLKRINISLDSLDSERYSRMTRGGDLQQVFDAVEAAIREELPVKINTVLIRGENDSETDDFIRLARDYPVDIRFIELMPIGKLGESEGRRVMNREILERHPELYPAEPRYLSQPSEDYTADGFRGRVGLISPISHRFCKDCNRVRLTSDGKLKMCLGQTQETDLMPYLAGNGEELLEVMRSAIYAKPAEHQFDELFHSNRTMNQIGG